MTVDSSFPTLHLTNFTVSGVIFCFFSGTHLYFPRCLYFQKIGSKTCFSVSEIPLFWDFHCRSLINSHSRLWGWTTGSARWTSTRRPTSSWSTRTGWRSCPRGSRGGAFTSSRNEIKAGLQDKAFITHCLLFTTILTNNLENTKNHQLCAFPFFSFFHIFISHRVLYGGGCVR